MARKGLGKGLQALIGAPSSVPVRNGPGGASESTDPETGEVVRRVSLEAVVPSPFQPRKRFDDENLGELVDSIREHGVIQPLIVRETGDKLELIAGERRWRACRELELDEVPVIVREATDGEALEMALIENIQREDLDPIEEAEAYSRLSKEFDLKQEEIARRVGKNRATVANSIRLLDLNREVQELVSRKHISAGHAKAILGIKNAAEQKLIAERVVKKGLNVRATERLVSDQINGRVTRKKSGSTSSLPAPVAAHIRSIEDRLRSRFATHISLKHGEKKGKIEIEYFGNDDLGRILELLGLPEE